MYLPQHRRNPPPTGKDELAGGAQGAPTDDSGIPQAPTDGSGTPIPATPRAPSQAPTEDSGLSATTSRASTLARAPVIDSTPGSTDELFKQVMKAYLEAQTQSTASSQAKPQEHPCKPGHPLKPNLFLRLVSPRE